MFYSKINCKCFKDFLLFSVQLTIIHVIFSWTQIGRFGFTDREIGSQIGRFFRGKNIQF